MTITRFREGIDDFGCINHTIKVAAGHYFDLANPRQSDIDLVSIAGALSRICRFGGHVPVFYSVAEHCVHAAGLCLAEGLQEHALSVLLHDASEAYCGDIVKPLKTMLPEYRKIESRIQNTVNAKFLSWPPDDAIIKRFDHLMLKAEKVHFWPDDTEEWPDFAGLPMPDVKISCWTPEFAESTFLKLARDLL